MWLQYQPALADIQPVARVEFTKLCCGICDKTARRPNKIKASHTVRKRIIWMCKTRDTGHKRGIRKCQGNNSDSDEYAFQMASLQ